MFAYGFHWLSPGLWDFVLIWLISGHVGVELASYIKYSVFLLVSQDFEWFLICLSGDSLATVFRGQLFI